MGRVLGVVVLVLGLVALARLGGEGLVARRRVAAGRPSVRRPRWDRAADALAGLGVALFGVAVLTGSRTLRSAAVWLLLAAAIPWLVRSGVAAARGSRVDSRSG